MQSMVQTAKQNYYMEIFNQTDKPARIWNKLRRLGLIKTKDASRRLTFSAEELNAFFASVGTPQADVANGRMNELEFLNENVDNFDD